MKDELLISTPIGEGHMVLSHQVECSPCCGGASTEPLLKIASDGQEHQRSDVADRLARDFKLTDEERRP